MCDQRCPQCKKCDEPETCVCGLEYSKQLAGELMQAICGHFVCEDCAVTCEGCEVLICPACNVKVDGSNCCGEGDCVEDLKEKENG